MPKRTDICVVILVNIGGPCIFQSLSILLCIPQGSYFLVDNGKSQLGPRGKLWCPLPSSPSSSPATEYLLSQNLHFLTHYVPFFSCSELDQIHTKGFHQSKYCTSTMLGMSLKREFRNASSPLANLSSNEPGRIGLSAMK